MTIARRVTAWPTFLIACLLTLLWSNASFAEPSSTQVADWAARSQQAQSLFQQADTLRTDADALYAREETLCYELVLTNSCREKARRVKVSAYQQARKLDIEGKHIELSVKQEEKTQKSADAAASEPEREFKARQRAESTEKRNQQQAEAREKRRQNRRNTDEN
ncbi:MAG: hypothetical protein RIR18_669 [Pseudomonadota bacterium]